MPFSIVADPQTTANYLNCDLDVTSKWAHQWKLEFNPDFLKQAVEVLFSCKKLLRFILKSFSMELLWLKWMSINI